ITGGSSGIGKCLAIEAAQRGASVTLLARDEIKLESAKTEITKHITDKEKQKIKLASVDICKDYQSVERIINEVEAELGPVGILINCAGNATASRFEDTPVEEFQRLMDVNYMGSVFVTRAVLPSMKTQRSGRIVFVSSQAGLTGIFGYSAYSASKFALRGLAESLSMEVKPFNIKITLGLPADTDTPGFEEEEKTKPIETKLISKGNGLFSPEDVAKQLMEDILQGKFLSSVGLEGSILCCVCAGMSPMSSFTELVTQVFTMGIFRLVSVVILNGFNSIVAKHAKQQDDSKKNLNFFIYIYFLTFVQ
uniref:3-dehydrosphinganine reductase n=1 Tax=Strigamia maritima TaxID=126957 RepID=T1J3U3_STRMM